MGRKIKYIVIHCSATREGQEFDAADIDKWHKKRGWSGIGYHYVVKLDGTIEVGRDESVSGAHVKGYNRNSIGICYIGGMTNPKSKKNKAKSKGHQNRGTRKLNFRFA